MKPHRPRDTAGKGVVSSATGPSASARPLDRMPKPSPASAITPMDPSPGSTSSEVSGSGMRPASAASSSQAIGGGSPPVSSAPSGRGGPGAPDGGAAAASSGGRAEKGKLA